MKFGWGSKKCRAFRMRLNLNNYWLKYICTFTYVYIHMFLIYI